MFDGRKRGKITPWCSFFLKPDHADDDDGDGDDEDDDVDVDVGEDGEEVALIHLGLKELGVTTGSSG